MSADRIEDRFDDAAASVAQWAASGAMALTGFPEEPLGPPAGMVGAVTRLGRRFGFSEIETLALLAERAALMGLWRRGTVSCGGSCRLLPTWDDGWLAASLPRAEDLDLVPAWLELSGDAPPSVPAVWSAVTNCVQERDSTQLVDRARLLGLAVCRLGEVVPTGPITEIPLGEAPRREGAANLLVVDLSALWAGPLCGDLLGRAGASVVKVESTNRPDGARRGPPAFFDLLNGNKRSVALDFTRLEDLRVLRQIAQRADVVIEASRPRALAQLGIDAAAVVRSGGPRVWISITGYGRDAGDRIAFGDDAAAAGGLVAWTGSGTTPAFCADAVGDPLTGLTAAVACLDALSRGGRWLLDVSMAAVCASIAGPTLPSGDQIVIADPLARGAPRAAPELGADTSRVLAELGIAP
jgi:hypothetical protein